MTIYHKKIKTISVLFLSALTKNETTLLLEFKKIDKSCLLLKSLFFFEKLQIPNDFNLCLFNPPILTSKIKTFFFYFSN